MSSALRARLLAFLAARVARAQDAEDLVQEVLMRVHARGDQLDEPQRREAWAYRIARNLLVDHYRRQGRSPEELGALPDELPTTDAEPTDDGAQSALAGCVPTLVARLPEPYREAVQLTDLGTLSQKDLAHHQGVSPSCARSRVQRGRQQLRQIFEDCCAIERDARSAPVDFTPRAGAPGCCAPARGDRT